MAEHIHVQVCYATPASDILLDLDVAPGTTLAQAVQQSGLLAMVPGIDLAQSPVGIFSKKKTLDTVLRDQDRVEVYRPLLCDPKETRRRRAQKKAA